MTDRKIPPDVLARSELLSILPLRNAVLFPASIVPINVGRPRSVRLIERTLSGEQSTIGILSQKRAEIENPGWNELYRFGTVARVLKVIKLGSSTYSVVLQGVGRFQLLAGLQEEPYLVGRVQRIEDRLSRDLETDALAINLKETARQLVGLTPNLAKETASVVENVTEPSLLADLVASNLQAAVDDKQKILETLDAKGRLRLCLQLLTRQLEMLKVKKEISSMVQEEMGKSQREYFLRQQLKAIKEELGEADDEESDLDELREKMAGAGLPAEAERVARKQIGRLRQMQSSSAEYTVTRTYLDWIVDLPWKKASQDKLDVADVRRVLDEDHYGLEKVKKRIVEYIAVRKLRSDKKGPILCFVGPPGVGKTSLGRSIARSIGRQFVRASLGGVHDEAEIRGHRRTYVGALPGRILQGMKKAGTINPVFMLDEVDKLGTDFRGDPGAALLEVLDPEQNNAFADHYLELSYDLAQVMFIATANVYDTIPAPLLDRMEVIDIPGYTRADKLRIARDHLIPKQLLEHGLTVERLEITDAAVALVIDSHTREAGVRNLERELATICRAVAVRVAGGEDAHVQAGPEEVGKILGPARHTPEVAERSIDPGIATGLAWTPAGGDIMFVEATKMPGRAQLHLTGQLGDVMKESAQAALSFVRSRAADYGVAEDFLEKQDVHIHVPSGGIPKDGASAGVAMFTALASLVMGQRVRADFAMTGEITLRGLVLPVGGVKEKVLAAHRAGIRHVILPRRNKKDLSDIPPDIQKDVELHFVHRMDEVLDLVLDGSSSATPARRRRRGSPAESTPQPAPL